MRKLLSALVLVFIYMGVSAQSPKNITGTWSSLKGEKTVMLEFSYDSLMVGKKTEAEYLSEKDPSFAEKWRNERPNRLEPKFETLLNKSTNTKGLKCGREYTESKYKILVHIVWLAPGWYAGVSSAPSEVTYELTLINKEDGNTPVATMKIERVQGVSMMSPEDMGERLKESFAKCGKILGNFFVKKVL